MTPILDLQRRFVEVGRIRMGRKGLRGEPQRIEAWRLTSASRPALEEAAALFGGEVTEWAGAPTPGQFELFTRTAALPIIVAPGPEPVSQWMEQWNRGGATHRCDTQTNFITDEPCSCDPAQRLCKATTRVNVMLPDLPGLGVWRFETHGYYAATELPLTIEFIRQAADRGQMLPGTLRIEQRQRIAGGKTTRFPVAVIDLDVNVRQLAAGTSGAVLPAPSREQVAITAGVQPVPHEPAPSAREQIEAGNTAPDARPRANSAAPLPDTRVRPRPVEVAGNPADDDATVDDDSDGGRPVITDRQRRRMFAIAKEAGLDNPDLKALVASVAGVGSTKDISPEAYDDVIAAIEKAGGDNQPAVTILPPADSPASAYDHPNAP